MPLSSLFPWRGFLSPLYSLPSALSKANDPAVPQKTNQARKDPITTVASGNSKILPPSMSPLPSPFRSPALRELLPAPKRLELPSRCSGAVVNSETEEMGSREKLIKKKEERTRWSVFPACKSSRQMESIPQDKAASIDISWPSSFALTVGSVSPRPRGGVPVAPVLAPRGRFRQRTYSSEVANCGWPRLISLTDNSLVMRGFFLGGRHDGGREQETS